MLTINQVTCALRFFYAVTLGRKEAIENTHSSLKYLTPAAYAATFTATDDRLRNPDQLRRSPVAQPAPQGVQNPETLTAAG
jgi:putative transposase